jgi:hypothetical protein
MNDPAAMSNTRTDFLADRLFSLTDRIEGIDPQLSRVVVPWVVRHPRYLPGFMRLARTMEQSKRVRARALAGGVQACRRFWSSALHPDAICVALAASPGT